MFIYLYTNLILIDQKNYVSLPKWGNVSPVQHAKLNQQASMTKSKRIILLVFATLITLHLHNRVVLGQATIHGNCGTFVTRANYINTAIGCIPINDFQSFTSFFLKWSIGLASGIGFLLLLYGSILIMTSSGDPKRLQAGQELLTATISGLLFIIFSVFILRIIGVDILGIFI